MSRCREEEGRQVVVHLAREEVTALLQVVERARKAQHFSATEATAANTLEALLPALREQVGQEQRV